VPASNLMGNNPLLTVLAVCQSCFFLTRHEKNGKLDHFPIMNRFHNRSCCPAPYLAKTRLYQQLTHPFTIKSEMGDTSIVAVKKTPFRI